MAVTNRITGLTKYERPFEEFNICETDAGEFVVYLDDEEIGTFSTRYRATLHVSCVSALAHGEVVLTQVESNAFTRAAPLDALARGPFLRRIEGDSIRDLREHLRTPHRFLPWQQQIIEERITRLAAQDDARGEADR